MVPAVAAPAPPALAVHGGAGSLAPDDASAQAVARRLAGVRAAAAAGWAVLARGGPALDAVEAAVRALEDDPLFNAGTGACLAADGTVELDASLMDGATLRCGAVAAVRGVKNPVSLARLVLERSPHVLLAGPGALAFARAQGVPACDEAALVTPRQRERWERLRAQPAAPDPGPRGTVGAVARDAAGHLAAATSTGGTVLKLPGRVGDSALPGCGTYADDALAAVSATGHGERIIQLTLARQCADAVGRGRSAAEAAEEAVHLLGARLGAEGGLVALGPRGDPAAARNTAAMAWAWARADGSIEAAM